jgi:hypothetical protein
MGCWDKHRHLKFGLSEWNLRIEQFETKLQLQVSKHGSPIATLQITEIHSVLQDGDRIDLSVH